MLFILETLVNITNMQEIIYQFSFYHYDFVPPVNHIGVHRFLLEEHRAIHMLIHDPENLKNSIILDIYAPAQN